MGGCGMTDVEQTAVGAGVGVDLDSQGNILFFAQFNRPINFLESGVTEAQVEVFSGMGHTPTQAARDITLAMPRRPLWSHADVFVLGETLARTDLAYMADFLARNRNIRKDALIVLANQASPYDIFRGDFPLALSSRELMNLFNIQNERFGVYLPVSCDEFLGKLAAPGIDPTLPQVTITEQKGRSIITLDGMAVFRQNHLVGSLNETESRGYRWLNSRAKRGGFIVLNDPWPGVDFVSLDVTQISRRTRPRIESGELIMDIEVKAWLTFYDQGGLVNVQKLENIAQLETLAAREIERQIRACIDTTQQLNGDILGWGQKLYRYYPQVWKNMEHRWYEVFPQVKAQIKVQADIRQQGLLDQPLSIRR